MRQVFAWLALLITTVAWASSLIFAKIVYWEVPPIHFVTLRYTLALPFLLIVLVLYSKGRPPLPKTRFEWKILLVVGFSGPFLSQVLQYIGLSMTTAAETLMLINMSPVFALILAAMFLDESITPKKIGGLVSAFLGMALIVLGGTPMTGSVEAVRLTGDTIVVISTLLFAINGVYGKIAVRSLDSVAVTFYSTLIGIPFMWLSALLLEDPLTVFSISLGAWYILAWVSIINTVVAFILYYESMRYIEASLVQIGLSLIAVWGVLLAIIFLGEPALPLQLVGGGLTLLGVALANLSAPKNHSE
ncbi:MAG: DMT family transporter [Candidatus Thorarchaeota archaeon]